MNVAACYYKLNICIRFIPYAERNCKVHTAIRPIKVGGGGIVYNAKLGGHI